MAEHQINGQAWPEGTTVTVYPAEAQPAGQDTVPSGSSVDSAVVASGSVLFDNLTEGRRYLAYASGKSVRFLVQPGSVDKLRPISGIEAAAMRDDLDTKVPKSDVEVNLADYALEGIPAQQVGWDAAVEATPAGGTLKIPTGQWHVPTPTVDKRMNVIGEGIGSALVVSGGAGVDGFVIDPGTLQWGVTLRDFAVIGASGACRYGFVARRLADSTLHDIYVKAGGEYEASLEGLLVCKTRIRCPGNNALFPYTSVRSTNGIRVVGSATHPANANTLDNVIEALTGDGLVVDATVGSPGSSNNEILGTYQGITGKPIHVKGAQHWKIAQVHVEAAGVVTIEDCAHGDIGRNSYMGVNVSLIDSDDITIDGASVNLLTIDSDSERTRLGRLAYNLLGTGGIADSGVGTTSDGRLVDVSGSNKSRSLPGAVESANLLRSDGLRRWDVAGPKPLGSTISPGTVTKAGDGQADTRKLFTPYSALMAGASAAYFEAVSSRALTEALGNYVTLSAWVYIASGQVNQPNVVIEANIVGGVGTVTGQAATVTDAWQRLSITVPVAAAASAVNLKLRNTVASTGDWYIAGTHAVLGRTAPRSRPSRRLDYLYAEATWDPASTADGASTSTTVTVDGAALGDYAVATISSGSSTGVSITARVTAADTVTVTITNHSGSGVDFGSLTARVQVEKWV